MYIISTNLYILKHTVNDMKYKLRPEMYLSGRMSAQYV